MLDGTVDATMIQESVLAASPAYAEGTRVIGRQERLPGPVAIVDADGDRGFAEEFSTILLGYQAPAGPETLFSGFAPYADALVEAFYADAERALAGVEPPAV